MKKVYISCKDGERYHTFKECPSPFKNCDKRAVSLEYAKKEGYCLCKALMARGCKP